VSKDGLIYTNRHVVKGEQEAAGTIVLVGVPSAKAPDELDFFQAEVVFATKPEDSLDFAILKIAVGKNYPALHPLTLPFAGLDLGAPVEVMGYPYVDDTTPCLSTGVLSHPRGACSMGSNIARPMLP
jgi:hypothetical protein